MAIFHVSRRGEKKGVEGIGRIRKNRCVLDLVRVNYVLTIPPLLLHPSMREQSAVRSDVAVWGAHILLPHNE